MDDLEHQISKIIDKIQIPFNQVTEIKTEAKSDQKGQPETILPQENITKMNEKRTNVTLLKFILLLNHIIYI